VGTRIGAGHYFTTNNQIPVSAAVVVPCAAGGAGQMVALLEHFTD